MGRRDRAYVHGGDMIEIELRRHTGIQQTALGPYEVDLRQYFVMVKTEWTGDNPVHVGFICEPCETNRNPPFNGLDVFRTLPQNVKDEIVSLVRHKLGLGVVRVTEVPEPVEIPEDEYEDIDEG